jgi:hypothetical protein
MSQQCIIEVRDEGRPAFICEQKGELYLTRQRSEAAVYSSELDAKCARAYIADRYQPRIVPVDASAPG